VNGGLRERVLRAYGASASETVELLSYNANVFDQSCLASPPEFPLPDEPHVSVWERYAEEAGKLGAFTALQKRLVQFAFPVSEGISASDAYLAATRQGVPAKDLEEATGLLLLRPDALRLVLHPTPAGRIPVLITPQREDFVTLVQALAMKNEPKPVPASQGASIVGGLVNWDRIRTLREQWEANRDPADIWTTWDLELRRIAPHKELYQDRLILLSEGPYSSVPAGEMGIAEEEWLRFSLTIRLEHECTHYFTRRLFGSMRNNLLDEVIADFMGIVAAAGKFRADWFLRFVGLDTWPAYREGGRLQNYRGQPPLSDAAFTILQALVRDAAYNLERFDAGLRASGDAGSRARVLLALTCFTLEELAADDVDSLLAAATGAARRH
jgi:hypothetical protein